MAQSLIVQLNDPAEEADIWNRELEPSIRDGRCEEILVDSGTRAHIVLRHPYMRRRIRWIREAIVNPEAIYLSAEHFGREVYLAGCALPRAMRANGLSLLWMLSWECGDCGLPT